MGSKLKNHIGKHSILTMFQKKLSSTFLYNLYFPSCSQLGEDPDIPQFLQSKTGAMREVTPLQ